MQWQSLARTSGKNRTKILAWWNETVRKSPCQDSNVAGWADQASLAAHKRFAFLLESVVRHGRKWEKK